MLYSRMTQATKDKLVEAYRAWKPEFCEASSAVVAAANQVLKPEGAECWVDVHATALKVLCLMGEVLIVDNPDRILGMSKELR